MFALDESRVLRRYRRGHSAVAQAVILRCVRECGYPAPAVHDVAGPDLVLERVHGPTMSEDLARHPWRLDAHARTLARLHQRLHEVSPPPGLAAPFGQGASLLHLDLHASNVLLGRTGPVVIDWDNAAAGPAEADVAMTWIIHATSAVEGPLALRLLARSLGGRFVRTFLRGLDTPALRAIVPAVGAARMRDRNVRGEERRRVADLIARVAS